MWAELNTHVLMDWRAGCSQYAPSQPCRATHPDTFDAYQAFWLDNVKYNYKEGRLLCGFHICFGSTWRGTCCTKKSWKCYTLAEGKSSASLESWLLLSPLRGLGTL